MLIKFIIIIIILIVVDICLELYGTKINSNNPKYNLSNYQTNFYLMTPTELILYK